MILRFDDINVPDDAQCDVFLGQHSCVWGVATPPSERKDSKLRRWCGLSPLGTNRTQNGLLIRISSLRQEPPLSNAEASCLEAVTLRKQIIACISWTL